jgi:cell division protein FtsB
MAKNSAHDKMILVRHKPGRRRRLMIQIALLTLVCASAAYYIGVFEMQIRHNAAVESLSSLSSQYRQALAENEQLKQQVENLKQSEAINERAKQEIQATIGELRDRVAQLQKDVTFYQGIMAPSKNNKGLQIQSMEFSALEQNRRYAYKIVLAQVASRRNYVEGVVAVNLVGKQDAESVVIPLRDVSSVQELGMKFRFKYFQEFVGKISLPEGFEPEQIQVVAQSKGKNASRVESNKAWSELIPGASNPGQ